MNLSRARSVVLSSCFLCLLSCRPQQDNKGDAAPPVDAAVTLSPLVAPALSQMPVAGFANAVFVSPVGATRPMPLVVAVLGIGDTPESQCAVWRELVGQRAFVICPRFTPHFVPAAPPEPNPNIVAQGLFGLLTGLQGDNAPEADPNSGAVVQSGFRPTELPEVEREIDAAVAAARKIFPKYIAQGPAVYVGFSRGAFLGASLIAKSPTKFSRAIMIEGGQSAWTDAGAAAFAKGGGKRVLFACGQPSCVAESEPASQLLTRSRIATKVVHGEGEGHNYKGPVKEQIRAAFPWLTEDDTSWKK